MITLKNIALVVGVLFLHVMVFSFNDLYLHYGIDAFQIESGILGAAIGSIKFGLSEDLLEEEIK